MKSSKSNSVKKAMKAFLGVRKRDVSKWPERDVPADYKQRLSNGKRNFGVETRGLKETRGNRDQMRRCSSQPPPSQHSSDSAYGDDLIDDGVYEYVPDPPTMYRDKKWKNQGDYDSYDEMDHFKDPWDDHKASKEQQAIEMVATTSKRSGNMTELTEGGEVEIDERLKSCISALDRLTTQLDTVVNLTEQIDQIREEVMPTGQQQQVKAQLNGSYYSPQQNQTQENKINEEDYHRGIMKGEAPEEEIPDKLPGRLPSRTPSTRKMLVARPVAAPVKFVGPDRRYQVQPKVRYNKKGNQLQEDNWSSSGYSSGSFDSISPYQQQYEMYGSYYPPADPYHQQYMYDHFYQEEGYGIWQDPAQAASVSGEWYYGGVGDHMNPYGYYSENGSYYDPYAADWSSVYRPNEHVEGNFFEAKPQDNDETESRASLPVSVDSGKRKTVRFSKMVQERQSDDGKDTTSMMKGSPPDDKKRRSGRRSNSKTQRRETESYEFPKGHIESSCMCGECILARKSLCEKKQKELGCNA